MRKSLKMFAALPVVFSVLGLGIIADNLINMGRWLTV
jgi:hypothetical protein